MPLDPNLLLGLPPIETQHVITRKDVILYALGIGATELPFVYEEGLRALPTMAVIATYPGFIWRDPRYRVTWQKLLHGESAVEWHAPLPVEGTLTGVTTLGPIFDKGADKGAVCYQTRTIHDAAGHHLATVRGATFLRADGGFGGTAEGQPRPHPLPDRAADATRTIATAENQALIYRLSGDLNPLHVDPVVAQAAGFPRPILHGLCSFGIAGRALLDMLCDGEPDRMRRMDARFSAPCFPGETLRIETWRESTGSAAFRVLAEGRGATILNNGYVEHA